jgi:hypothetical protein
MSFRISNPKGGGMGKEGVPLPPPSSGASSTPPSSSVPSSVPKTIIIFDKKENRYKIINENDKHKYIT